jgi:hypothetical protein
MKPAPPLEEATCFLRAQVELSAFQPFVGRQNHDKRERNNQQEEYSPKSWATGLTNLNSSKR